MRHASWMIERLDRETRVHHADAAEGDFDLLFRERVETSDYVAFLLRVYGFVAPLEVSLAMTPNIDLVIDVRQRHKAGFIAKDLLALRLSPAQVANIPMCTSIPQFRGAAEALGWLYVVDRATLAFSVVRRHLTARLPYEMSIASDYLQCYAGVAGKRWRELGSVLDDIGRHPSIADRVLFAAHEAFRTQRRWLTQGVPALAPHDAAV